MIEFRIEDYDGYKPKVGVFVNNERKSKHKTLRVKIGDKDWKFLKSKSGDKVFVNASKANDQIHEYMHDKVKPGMSKYHIHWRTLIL